MLDQRALLRVFWICLALSGATVFWHQYSRLVAAAHEWQAAQPHERTFADELATIPGAFDGAMREDRPDLVDREHKGDWKGGALGDPHKTNVLIFRRKTD